MSESIPDKQIVVRFPNHVLPASLRENMGKEGATVDNMDPSCPFLVLEKYDRKKSYEWLNLRAAWVAKSMPNDIIIPDPTPERVRDAFSEISRSLSNVMAEDSVQCFLNMFLESPSTFAYRFTITSETLTFMIRYNALRCMKAVLEGKAPGLGSMHANPNCMSPYGCFPLHEAAERCSPRMIRLLFRHGASANYREDCVYRLVHLLCLPDMIVSLEVIRLLAQKTDNVVDELWNYMKNGKLAQATVLFLAAQKHFRKGKPNGFSIIAQRIFGDYDSLTSDKGNGEAHKQLEERKALLNCQCLLYNIISQAGEALYDYVQTHSEVSHVEVLAHVSSILKEFGFCPKEEYIDTMNLSPYNLDNFYSVVFQEGQTKPVEQTSSPNAAEKKAMRKIRLTGSEPSLKRRGFFRYRRLPVEAQSLSTAADDKSLRLHGGQLRNYSSTSMSNESLVPNHNIGLLGRIQQLIDSHQSRRCRTAAFDVLRKVLKHA
ncbi:hypothetical protein OsJ_06135 [Oryza sativa Japonica Group]|uniref:Uncharacterized protein n=1 Tax=Oryza sativa subsp. japonica TaxID=39947 RepID=B9F4V2_ORYSJ|nr:hypothetical protein OsJ_06135 [Oryza sativa Japonica Group]KAF2944070.1 hypothetical protein DAI22_02g112800 [Oryza sativa Japonica Group]